MYKVKQTPPPTTPLPPPHLLSYHHTSTPSTTSSTTHLPSEQGLDWLNINEEVPCLDGKDVLFALPPIPSLHGVCCCYHMLPHAFRRACREVRCVCVCVCVGGGVGKELRGITNLCQSPPHPSLCMPLSCLINTPIPPKHTPSLSLH